MSGSTGWAQLRQQARSLETQTEGLFNTYSQYSTPSTISPKASQEESKTDAQIEELLSKRETLLTQLTRLLDSESSLNSSSLKTSNLARHRDILSEHRRELQRIRSSIGEARSRANLLSSVHSDIAAYRASNPAAAEEEYMLDERNRLEGSHRVADGVLSQAYAINDNFRAQRETLASVNRRIVGAASQIPGINTLMQRIGAKKRRDGIILGGFIAVCFLMVFMFS